MATAAIGLIGKYWQSPEQRNPPTGGSRIVQLGEQSTIKVQLLPSGERAGNENRSLVLGYKESMAA
jgi:hypothetical protein